MKPAGEPRYRRVIVALDGSPASLAAAHAAARIAAITGAQLVGLFVEDSRLLNLSRSPLAHSVDLLTLSFTRWETGSAEEQFRGQAARARRVIERLAAAQDLHCTFRVSRGSLPEQICQFLDAGDLISLGRTGWSIRCRGALAPSARALLGETGRSLLLIESGQTIRAPVALLFGASEVSDRALEVAQELAGHLGDDPLAVLLIGPDPASAEDRLTQRLGGQKPSVAVVDLAPKIDDRSCQMIRNTNAGICVVPISRGGIELDDVERLLRDTGCPVLLLN